MGSYQSTLGPIPLASDASVLIFGHGLPTPSVLVSQDKMWSVNDSGTVSYSDGRPYCKIKGSSLGMGQTQLQTLDGQPILSIQKQFISFESTYHVHQGAGGGSPTLTMKRLDLTGADGKWKIGLFVGGQAQPLIVIKGSPFDGFYYAFLGEPKSGAKKIVEIMREKSAPCVPPKYFLRIAPNIDMGLACCIGMYVEELEEAARKKK